MLMLGPHTHGMALHLFRPQDPTAGPTPPVGTWAWALWAEKAGYLLNWVAGLLAAPRARATAHTILLLVGLVGQALLLLMGAYLVDLSVSLMELWAELARKHLELTL
jgi:hypothetical protein